MGKNMADVLLKMTTIAVLEYYSLIPYRDTDAWKVGTGGHLSSEGSFIPV